MNPWLGMGIVLAVLGGLMVLLRLYQRHFDPHPEWVRKLLHMGMGLVTLTFPWLFAEAWPVVLLAGLSVLALLATRWLRGLKHHLGAVVNSVNRTSLGEIYFPIGVAILFVLFHYETRGPFAQRVLLYEIPILILALADALAALVGIRFGRHIYDTVDGRKSTEGSLAFFAVAGISTFFPLWLWGEVAPDDALLTAVLVGFLAMMFEAIAWHGLDNLLLPLTCFLLLRSYLHLESAELTWRLLVTALLVGIAMSYRHWTTLSANALMGSVLVGYLSWSLGGWLWLLAPLLFFSCYALLPGGPIVGCQIRHNIHAVLCISSAGLVWLFLANLLKRPDWLSPYNLAFAAHLGIIALVRLKRGYPKTHAVPVLLVGGAAGGSLALITGLPEFGLSMSLLTYLGIAVLGVVLAVCAFASIQPGLHDCPTDTPRWLRQALVAGLASLLGLMPAWWHLAS
ncbi:MAG: hypothetical protein ACK4RK_21305 [Gemmataceae bacterium]